jgi:hypothetical protein
VGGVGHIVPCARARQVAQTALHTETAADEAAVTAHIRDASVIIKHRARTLRHAVRCRAVALDDAMKGCDPAASSRFSL